MLSFFEDKENNNYRTTTGINWFSLTPICMTATEIATDATNAKTNIPDDPKTLLMLVPTPLDDKYDRL